jgi:hypothetical protein
MMKLVSFVVFIAAFVWTWFLFNSHSKISLATHAGIQSKFMVLIEDTIKAAKPNSSDFEILSIYTEKIDDNQVGAHFSYKYTDHLEAQEKATQEMSGTAVLYRGLSENPNDDKWIVKSIKTDNSTIEFQQGMTINPESSSAGASGDVTTASSSGDSTTPAVEEEKKTH